MKNYVNMILVSICFMLLVLCIHTGLTNGLDAFVYHWLHELITADILVHYLSFISAIFSPLNCLIMVLFILLVLFFFNKVKFWWYGFWCFSVFAIGTFLKYVIQRPRPSIDIDGYSFPSMHVLSVCLLVSLILLLKNSKILSVICVLLVISIMISRIYLQAHYFTDTLGSLLVLYIMLQSIYIGREPKAVKTNN
ncbi:phosphatase PAP2 family protein [Staphylococcus pseudoxylosus]|uniref:Phosphatase PAP2 family protein n=1 Tax=Staphylococcus pseudoxylosus TaxID=2282419 RepID=A0AAQ0MJQ3_9STAP|nr:phosphatase PAP2 family protein [Staphylococcus pseudoxylosus]MCE5002329.1 phosphatase PAP2 family protein [Staphylococcus pseudoxylosus]MEB5781966.1 phosphatase PAP2 family protein [Staphylococcus pseudoxylosus]MEB6171166.1 phosphatase PAP2 family protein [Staphylococcus pseudoxylosus]MEB6331889.1 phosphatase PAP2 family protein [Staphylococcus pseudoxylosus]RMI85146.1 phosphatase PAP2 family protein [Staphylococcus pseudoxylosus]